MTRVCITSEYRTLIYFDACFDTKTILVNMPVYIERVYLISVCVIFDTTIPRDHLAN